VHRLGDRCGLAGDAAAREHRVGLGELDERDLAVAERETEPVVRSRLIERREADRVEPIEQRLRADLREHAHRRDVRLLPSAVSIITGPEKVCE